MPSDSSSLTLAFRFSIRIVLDVAEILVVSDPRLSRHKAGDSRHPKDEGGKREPPISDPFGEEVRHENHPHREDEEGGEDADCYFGIVHFCVG